MKKKRFTSILLTAAMLGALLGNVTTASAATTNFSDVQDSGKYYYKPVYWAVEQGITSGTSATTFGPNESCTRAQIVTFLWKSAGSPEAKAVANFSDVPSTSWYSKAVNWAVENNITSGTTATTFGPSAPCTRAQAVTFLWKSTGAPSASTTPTFTDVESGKWYTPAVAWAVETDITGGVSTTSFAPGQTCTRGQIVTFIWKSKGQNKESENTSSSIASIYKPSSYNGQKMIKIHNNTPDFTLAGVKPTTVPYVIYDDLDSIGRSKAVLACLDSKFSPLPTLPGLVSVEPTGWHDVKYDGMENNLYEKCQLLALSLKDDNAKNIFTGTYQLYISWLPKFLALKACGDVYPLSRTLSF